MDDGREFRGDLIDFIPAGFQPRLSRCHARLTLLEEVSGQSLPWCKGDPQFRLGHRDMQPGADFEYECVLGASSNLVVWKEDVGPNLVLWKGCLLLAEVIPN